MVQPAEVLLQRVSERPVRLFIAEDRSKQLKEGQLVQVQAKLQGPAEPLSDGEAGALVEGGVKGEERQRSEQRRADGAFSDAPTFTPELLNIKLPAACGS